MMIIIVLVTWYRKPSAHIEMCHVCSTERNELSDNEADLVLTTLIFQIHDVV